MPEIRAVLSIQSDVVHGHVGNGAARFALQRLGYDVWALPTVLLSNHPGHPKFRGETTPAAQLRALLAGHGLTVSSLSWRFKRGEGVAEYRMTVRAGNEAAVQRLCAELKGREEIVEYRAVPVGH